MTDDTSAAIFVRYLTAGANSNRAFTIPSDWAFCSKIVCTESTMQMRCTQVDAHVCNAQDHNRIVHIRTGCMVCAAVLCSLPPHICINTRASGQCAAAAATRTTNAPVLAHELQRNECKTQTNVSAAHTSSANRTSCFSLLCKFDKTGRRTCYLR